MRSFVYIRLCRRIRTMGVISKHIYLCCLHFDLAESSECAIDRFRLDTHCPFGSLRIAFSRGLAGEDCPKFMAHKLIRCRMLLWRAHCSQCQVQNEFCVSVRKACACLSPDPFPPLSSWSAASSAAAHFPPYLIKSDLHTFPCTGRFYRDLKAVSRFTSRFNSVR